MALRWTIEIDDWLIKNHNPKEYKTREQITIELNNLFKTDFTTNAVCTRLVRLGLKNHRHGQATKIYKENEINWLKNNVRKFSSVEELRKVFNQKFHYNLKIRSFYSLLNRFNCVIRQYSKEQKQWILENYKGTPYKELAEKFNAKFGTVKTPDNLRNFLQKLNLKNGRLLRQIGCISLSSNGYRYKYREGFGTKGGNWIFIPNDVALNNNLVSNCAEAYVEVKLCEKELKETFNNEVREDVKN